MSMIGSIVRFIVMIMLVRYIVAHKSSGFSEESSPRLVYLKMKPLWTSRESRSFGDFAEIFGDPHFPWLNIFLAALPRPTWLTWVTWGQVLNECMMTETPKTSGDDLCCKIKWGMKAGLAKRPVCSLSFLWFLLVRQSCKMCSFSNVGAL